MEQAKKPKSSRPVKKEEVSPVETSTPPVQEKKYPDKPNPNARPKKVYVTESGLTIEEY